MEKWKKIAAGIVICATIMGLPESARGQSDSGRMTLTRVTDRTVSDRLVGYNIVYAKNPDKLWESGVLARGIRATNPGFLRYPGGTVVTYFHWKNPTGNGWEDSWNPAYDPGRNLDGSQFMDVDEYFELLKKTGAEPLMGINVNSGFVWNRLEEGIQEALDLMRYCKERGVKVKYWYLGNEPYMHDCNGGEHTVAEYAEMVNTFASRMKAYDPDIRIVANWRQVFRKRDGQYEELFRLAGKNIDVIDVHWYCMWAKASWDLWLSKNPVGVDTGHSYLSEIRWFRETAARCGFPDMKLASLEWNVGPGRRVEGEPMNAAQCALVASEMMMQFIEGGLDMATMWPLFWDSDRYSKRPFFDRQTGKLNPVSDILKFFGRYQGLKLVDFERSGLNERVMSIAVQDPKRGETHLCLLNKNATPVEVAFDGDAIRGNRVRKCSVFAISEDLQRLNHHSIKPEKRNTVRLEPYSLTFVVLY